MRGGGPTMRRGSWCWCCLAALVLAAAVRSSPAEPSSGAPAQQPPQPSQPVFRTGANVVRVDVTVLDRKGNPVSALTAEDFEIEEDGVPQQIQSFKLVEATGQPTANDDRSLAIRSREDVAMEAARDEVRVVVILWDEYYIGQMDSAIRARRFLTSFVTSALAPLDLVAVVDQFTPVDMIPFTRDRSELTERIRTLRGRRGIYYPPRNLAEEAHILDMRNIGRIRSEVTLSALQSTAVRLGGLREGRKAILFVSEGPVGLGTDWYSRLQELVRAANDANTAIYTVDPRGLTMRRLPNGMLEEIAANTGGKAFLNSNEPERMLGHVVKDLSAYYLIGYESSQNPADGSYHRIVVRVRRKGLDVLARRGYWAPSAADIARAREAAAAAEPPPEVKRALSALVSVRRGGSADLWIGTARAMDGPEVTVAWTPRHGSSGNGDAPASISVTARGSDGRVWFDENVTERCVRFAAPPGVLQVRTVYHGAGGEDIGGDTREVVVPDFSLRHLALSTPVVLRARTEAERRALETSAAATPFPGREFLRTDRLIIRFQLYGAGSAVVSAALLDRTGRVRAQLPVGPAGDRAGTYQMDLLLTFAAPGEYLISIAAANGEEKAETLVPIRVLSR